MLLAGGGKTGHFIHGNRLNRYVIFIDLFRFLLSKLVLLLVFIFIILTFLNRVWIYSYKGEDRQPLPFPEYVFKGRSWAPLHLLDRLLCICGNSLLAPRNFALGQLNIHSEPVRVERIVRILLLGLLLWMQELASEAVRTIKVFMVLFAQLGLIVLWDMLLFLQLPAAMSEWTLNSCLLLSISNVLWWWRKDVNTYAVIELTIPEYFPVSAHLCLIFNYETWNNMISLYLTFTLCSGSMWAGSSLCGLVTVGEVVIVAVKWEPLPVTIIASCRETCRLSLKILLLKLLKFKFELSACSFIRIIFCFYWSATSLFTRL